MATISDIARRANVSKTTVSRVLNGRPDVDRATAERVRQVVAELGFVPSASARALVNGRAKCVGLLIPSLDLAWVLPLVEGVADRVEAREHTLTLHTIARGEESLAAMSAQVNARVIDGLVAVVPHGLEDYLRRFVERGLPVALIDDRDLVPAVPRVWATDRAGGEAAARHLVALDRLPAATITGPLSTVGGRERLAGFRQALAEAGDELDPSRVREGDWTIAGGRAAMRSLLSDHPDLRAVFAANDLMAIGAMRAVVDAGRRVPDDVAIVGYDDIPFAAQMIPALTTVRQPLAEMAGAAAAAVLDATAGNPWEPG
ncbi:MAG TPA: LacI family DNA-binding transcriptional regulator, partial [Thermomicrobiales bacterium]|nr:LacI family DNA-binding transcriptional regulator [Thermomicrobiales bacterium]